MPPPRVVANKCSSRYLAPKCAPEPPSRTKFLILLHRKRFLQPLAELPHVLCIVHQRTIREKQQHLIDTTSLTLFDRVYSIIFCFYNRLEKPCPFPSRGCASSYRVRVPTCSFFEHRIQNTKSSCPSIRTEIQHHEGDDDIDTRLLAARSLQFLFRKRSIWCRQFWHTCLLIHHGKLIRASARPS